MKEKRLYPSDPEELTAGHFSERISIDRMGSYTGITENPWDMPVQDADDL